MRRDAHAVVTRGVGTLGIDPKRCGRPSVFIIADLIQLYPKELYSKGIPIITSSILRTHPSALSPRVKSLNYLNNILAKIEAIEADVLEAIMLNVEGYVSECTGENIFVARHGMLITPPTSAGALRGITQDSVMTIAEDLGFTVRVDDVSRSDLYIAEELFVCGTAAEVSAVNSVDDRVLPCPGPMTTAIAAEYGKAVRGQVDRYKNWLEHVNE